MSARSWLILLGAGALLVLGAHAFDTLGVERSVVPDGSEKDWFRLLRVMGYVPTWLLLGVVFVLIDRERRDALEPPLRDIWTRAVLLGLSATSAGGVAEILKLIIRRERPLGEPAYDFRPFSELTWSSADLGMPSSHTSVAFGALVMLGLLHPPARVVLLLVGVGTAMTRVKVGAHFVSDAALGVVVGSVCAYAWWALHLRNLAKSRGTMPS
jgi:membrane-associated phospholipid phosphatase